MTPAVSSVIRADGRKPIKWFLVRCLIIHDLEYEHGHEALCGLGVAVDDLPEFVWDVDPEVFAREMGRVVNVGAKPSEHKTTYMFAPRDSGFLALNLEQNSASLYVVIPALGGCGLGV